MIKSDQALSATQKLFFGLFCWGVRSWDHAGSYKSSGYHQKYRDARKAMHTGLAVYGLCITFFILILLLNRT